MLVELFELSATRAEPDALLRPAVAEVFVERLELSVVDRFELSVLVELFELSATEARPDAPLRPPLADVEVLTDRFELSVDILVELFELSVAVPPLFDASRPALAPLRSDASVVVVVIDRFDASVLVDRFDPSVFVVVAVFVELFDESYALPPLLAPTRPAVDMLLSVDVERLDASVLVDRLEASVLVELLLYEPLVDASDMVRDDWSLFSVALSVDDLVELSLYEPFVEALTGVDVL